MKSNRSKHFLALLAVLFILMPAIPAFAYLDPGTGSVIYQAVIVIFLAVAATGRFWWTKIKKIFVGNSTKKNADTNEQ